MLAYVLVSIVCIFWWRHRYDKEIKPFTSYARLNNLAMGMDDYKQRNGRWPTDISELVKLRPDLVIDTTDAYGGAVILVDYQKDTGYGELISYGSDKKPGGTNKYERDVAVRFPTDDEKIKQWNEQECKRVHYTLGQ